MASPIAHHRSDLLRTIEVNENKTNRYDTLRAQVGAKVGITNHLTAKKLKSGQDADVDIILPSFPIVPRKKLNSSHGDPTTRTP